MANRSRPTPKSDEEEWEQTLVVRGRGVQDRQPTSGYCCIRANFVSLCNLINLGSQVMRMQTLATVLTSKHGRVPVWNFLPQVSRESGSRRLATGLGELFTEDEIPRASDERLLNQKWLEGSLSTEGPLGAGLRPWKLKAIPRCATLRPPSPTLIPSLPLPPLI